MADVSTPGFQKLSIIYVPDVGLGGTYQLRFVRRGSDGAVTEDRAANIAAVVAGFLRKPLVDSVEYAPERDPNRCTVRFVPGATVNAERIELFSNARESATRPADGVFFALESLRQVTLGYTTQYNTPRVAVTDYEHVWTYRRLPPSDGDGGRERVRATLSTAGYVQPNEALRYTSDGVPGAAPQLGGLLAAATEPVVLYSHSIDMVRAA